MRFELLAADLLLLTLPLGASFGRSSFFIDRWARAWTVAAALTLPGWIVLAALTARGTLGWSETRSLAGAIDLFGLPPGALLLVPIALFAGLFCWGVGFAEREPRSPKRLLAGPQLWVYLGAVALLSVALEGALLQRGVAVRSPAAVWRVINVPLSDLAIVTSLAGVAVGGFELLGVRAAASGRKRWIARWIERRLGGYRRPLANIDEDRPTQLEADKRVAVIGSGLAGLGATSRLAARGFAVSLFERNDYLGGKVGAWTTTTDDGRELAMSHGFHAFFHHYYNLNAWLEELGVTAHYRDVGDYLILTRDGRRYSFAEVSTTPVLNLLSLARHGVYRLREVAKPPTGPKMEAMLRYDPVETFAAYDQVSYAQFAEDARLPDSLRLVFNTFSRAFFSDADKMSMAELIKSFHFYYLSNDGGLIYDYLDDDYALALLGPIRAQLERDGVEIHTNTAVESVEREADGRFTIADQRFDYLVVASDVVGTRALFERSPSLAAAAAETAAKVETLRPGQRYAVLRLWLDRKLDHDLPVFVITERIELLDSVTFVDVAERHAAAWVAEREAAGQGGGVIELHCYALPDDLPDDEAQIRAKLIAELDHFFPALADAEVVHAHMYVRQDFPAFHVGAHASRPSWDTELDNLYLAGDWVTLPIPAMLMEAAYSAGLLAANAICRREGVRETPVWTVPLRGLMADLPKRPGST